MLSAHFVQLMVNGLSEGLVRWCVVFGFHHVMFTLLVAQSVSNYRNIF